MAYVFRLVSRPCRLDVKTVNASQYVRLSGPGGLSPLEGGDLMKSDAMELHDGKCRLL